MPNLPPEFSSPNQKKTSEKRWPRKALITCILLAAVFFAATILLEARHSGTATYFTAEQLFKILAEACLHLAIAFVVAGTVIALIEIRAQQAAEEENEKFRKQILSNAHQALYERLVPPEVFAEINNILHTDIVRSNCKYVITFLPPDEGMPDDSFIV